MSVRPIVRGRPWRHVTAVLGEVRRHPRHLVLAAAVAGLLVGCDDPILVIGGLALLTVIAGSLPVVLVSSLALLLGAVVTDARTAAVGPHTLPTATGRFVEADAVLLEPVRRRRNGLAAARVRVLGPARPTVEHGESPRVALTPERIAAAARGEQAVVRARDGQLPDGLRVGGIGRISGWVEALGPFDGYQRRRGAHVAIALRSWSDTGSVRGGPPGVLDAARERAAKGLATGLPTREASLLRGMVLGQDELISDDVRRSFEISGLAHLLAVSGQNVLLLSTLALAVGALVGFPLRFRLVGAVALVVAYVPLAGAGPSIQRAGVMGVAGLVAALAGRPSSRWYALGLAAGLTLAVNPHAAGEPGWQLSFAAVGGLLALAPRMREALARWRAPAPVADVAAITLAATLTTAPLLALHFEELSLMSLPANLAAAPAVPPLMWLGMLAIAVGQLSADLAAPLNALNAPLLAYVAWVAELAADVPHASVALPSSGLLAMLIAYLGLAAICLGWGHASRRLQMMRARVRPRAGVALAISLGALVTLGIVSLTTRSHAPRRLPGELVVSFLDVGQGDATLLQHDGVSVLVDTGPPGGPILRRLADAGVKRLDLLVLTHAQADHDGMTLPVVDAHRPRLVLDGGAGWPTAVQHRLPAALAGVGAQRVTARAGQTLSLGAMRLRILWPPEPPVGWRPEGDPNDRAAVAHVSVGRFDLLLPADAESNVTAALDLPRVEALKVAHHGSEDSGLSGLLARLNPRVAAIEVGRGNSYGHPAPSTLRALQVVQDVVRTDRDGTVRLRVQGDEMRLERSGTSA